ncbi:MAG: aspartate aminotransferase family protein [Candidatus Falkowbacteria bacterium]
MENKKFSIFPPFYPDITITRADGVYVYDKDNKKYIDLSASAGMCDLGYNNNEINRVIADQIKKLTVAPQKYRTPEREALVKKILSLFPQKYDAVIPAVTGSEAVEAAMQTAVNLTGQDRFLSFDRAYHGRTFAAGSLGEGFFGFGIFKDNFDTVRPPLKQSEVRGVIKKIAAMFKVKKYAAAVVEGVITNAGYLFPPPEFYRALSGLCHRHKVLLIFDEVLTGFGRTGKMFSFEYHGILPDLVCLSKNIAAGQIAMGAVVAPRFLVEGYEGYSAFTWPPLGCAIALKSIDIIVKKDLVSHSRKLGRVALLILKKQLDNCPYIDNISGLGLGMAIKFNSSETARRVHEACLAAGIMLFRKLDVSLLVIQPPLIIKREELMGALKKVIAIIKKLC